jgi:hypothetical protein
MRALVVSLFALLLAAPALGADGEPRKELTAKGQAIARAVVLKKSDLSAGYRSERESSAAWRRAGTAAAVRCFADLVRLTSPAPRKVHIVAAKRIPFPKVGPSAIAYRVIASVEVGGRTVKAYFDAILLRRGAVQSALVVTSVGRAVGRDQERALAGVLAGRMAKAAAPSGPVA